MSFLGTRVLLALFALVIASAACGGGGGGGGGSKGGGGGTPGSPSAVTNRTCSGECSQRRLTQAQAQRVISQAVALAQSLGREVTIAVVDRVGNVLGVFQMTGARANTTIASGLVGSNLTGLEGVVVPSSVAAISKAGTAAYLSTQGNAFTTRTANQIIQEHFNPHEDGMPGGPLFGVQFSQLPCGDLVRRFGANANEGPKRMPLGFSADPGGVPLYIDGVPVGGVGIEFDGDYTIDRDIRDQDVDEEERIALAGALGFEAPEDRRANRITVDGRSLRFADDQRFAAPSVEDFADINGVAGALVDVSGFFTAAGGVLTGAKIGTNASGIAPTTLAGMEAETLVDSAGVSYPFANPRDSVTPVPGAGGLTRSEVRSILKNALKIANRARAQIRRPVGTPARVNISVVDTGGNVIGFIRSVDAPIFGIDVSLQKARTAAFFSNTGAAADLNAAPDPPAALGADPFSTYVTAVQSFVDPAALTDGTAFSDRAGGNLSRPYFPDGIDHNPNGPFSRPMGEWSPFSTGLQLDLVLNNLAGAICPYVPSVEAAFFPGGCPASPTSCTEAPITNGPDVELANGIQIFPGSVPIYKNGTLVGGIGVSGDGVDQDDLIAFLGLHVAGAELGGTIGNAAKSIRADNLSGATGDRLRYVNCPPAPFLDSEEQDPCEGL